MAWSQRSSLGDSEKRTSSFFRHRQKQRPKQKPPSLAAWGLAGVSLSPPSVVYSWRFHTLCACMPVWEREHFWEDTVCLSQRSRIYAAAEWYFKFLGGCQVTVAWSNGKVFFCLTFSLFPLVRRIQSSFARLSRTCQACVENTSLLPKLLKCILHTACLIFF